MRVSKKLLQTCVNNINHYTHHKAEIFFTQGCGVYLTIDGVEHSKIKKDGSYEGITNKKAYQIITNYDNEIIEGYNKRLNKK